MAKELPYFQFEPGEYLTGNIQFCSLAAQGLFTNIISIYWQRECNFTLEQLKRKFENEILIKELIDEKIIKVDKKNNLIISFLDKQFIQITDKKKLLSDAGRKGALKKKQATLKPPLSEAEAIREEKRREEKMRKEEIINNTFETFWNLYPVSRHSKKDYCLKYWFTLSDETRQLIIDKLPTYLKSVSDETFLKQTEFFFKNKKFEDGNFLEAKIYDKPPENTPGKVDLFAKDRYDKNASFHTK